ncbi:nitrate- and nitrite sensing domain-containing protein [Streptomyces echinoruber]|uniref:histidine kinase n=1 Tax=Streptomyces echinoruber TaxID=68898 RepID=A0A918RIW1_9ACTN|nr:nitrate- and nitrite sensing domain-containing protein [Streptomyces echinoruber]GGZ99694.1 histidine kinase [Streptomyces echinoruber]
MSPRTGARSRPGSLRLSLILLALVPSVTLAAMWGVTTTQMFTEGLRLRSQTGLSRSTGAMGTEAALALQQERTLSAAWLASPHGSRAALDAQRRRTDAAVAKLAGRSDAIRRAPSRIKDRMYSVVAAAGSLEYYRDQVDRPTDITPQQALDQYTSIIDDQIHAFQELSQVDDGDLTSRAGPLVALEHAAELVSQENAQLTLAWPDGRLDREAWNRFAELVDARRWLVQDQIMPSLTGSLKTRAERILQSPAWRTLEDVEEQVLQAPAQGRTVGHGDKRHIRLPDAEARWKAALGELSAAYRSLIRQQTDALLDRSAARARHLLLTAGSLSAGGLVALLVCVGMSWRITRSLSRRLGGLRRATLALAQERLPEVVARLERGEKVDVESATPPLDYGRDELGQVAQAFNTAQRTAVHTAVELADTRRGFRKVILGIARQSQNLVNLQLSKLDRLEREHTDPDVLQGLYELDSVASQLRRYEENLVIISGERPGRTWSEPVALVDILHSAVGEVAEYQRVEVHTDEEVCLAPPAVADVIHLLAELIDNATVYSPAPSPVSVRASMVAKGLAVEVEDRGLGMSEEEYAALNAQLAVAPQFDVVALADDLRLGMFVVARLAHRHGISVTLRPSPYGGTTAIVLVPHDVVVSAEDGTPAADGASATDGAGAGRPESTRRAPRRPADPVRPPVADAARSPAGDRGTERAPAGDRNAAGDGREAVGDAEADGPARSAGTDAGSGSRSRSRGGAPSAAPSGGLAPLPRRVPQTSLAAELREEPAPAPEDEDADDFTAQRAASSLAGFQRGTRQARDATDATNAPDAGHDADDAHGTYDAFGPGGPYDPHAPHAPRDPSGADHRDHMDHPEATDAEATDDADGADDSEGSKDSEGSEDSENPDGSDDVTGTGGPRVPQDDGQDPVRSRGPEDAHVPDRRPGARVATADAFSAGRPGPQVPAPPSDRPRS